MNKFLLLIFLLMAGSFAHAQYTVTGTVLNTSGTPISNKQVFVRADSTVNPKWLPSFYLQDSTDVNGVYTITLPSTVVTGMQIVVSTVNCNNVLLTKTYAYNGSNITSNYSICTGLTHTISGQVSMGNINMRAPNAKLQLYAKTVDSVIGGTTYYKLQAIDSVVASSNGNFAFSYPMGTSAELLLRASFQSFSGHYTQYAPTYAYSVLNWPSAPALLKDTSSATNILMKPVVNTGGPGSVSGFVVEGAGKPTGVGDPVPNRLILLTTLTDSVIAFTLSDNTGTFYMPNIPYGAYKIFGDVPGKTSQPLIFALNAQFPNASFITFDDKRRTFNPRMPPMSVAQAYIPAISIAPNPARDRLTINSVGADCSAAIYDITGRRVMNNIQLRAGYINEVNISQLPQGNYILQIATDKGHEPYKFIKE